MIRDAPNLGIPPMLAKFPTYVGRGAAVEQRCSAQQPPLSGLCSACRILGGAGLLLENGWFNEFHGVSKSNGHGYRYNLIYIIYIKGSNGI